MRLKRKNLKQKFTRGLLTVVFCLALPSIALAINTSLPTIKNPFDQLQVQIPGMARFTDAKIIQNGNSQTLSVNWIAEYIAGFYSYAISIIGVFAVLGIAIGGVIWLVSMGNPSRVAQGKEWITSSLLGLALALGSYLILHTISPGLVTTYGQNLLILKDTDLDAADLTSAGGILTGTYNGRPTFSRNVNLYDDLLKQMSAKYGVDCTLAKATMMAESNGNPSAVSNAGAGGLMQLMPGTFASMNVGSNVFDPATNIEAGVKYMGQLKTTACGGSSSNSVCNVSNVIYRIAAYNGGSKANKPSTWPECPGQTFWQCIRNIRYGQTRNYVLKVQADYNYLLQQGWGC